MAGLSRLIAKELSEMLGGFQDVATPVKTVGRGSKKKFVRDVNTKGEERGSIVIPTEETVEPLVARQGRALASESSVSVMPAPGKFFNPKNSSYKGDRMSGMLEEANIELDLDFGNYIVMGKKPQDVSDKTFQNLFITPRTSNKELSTYASKVKDSKVKVDNKTIARANAYDGPDLTLKNMQDNYERNVGRKGTVYRTNLVQPSLFSLAGNRRLNHPIVAVQAISGPEAKKEASKAVVKKAHQHYYSLDMQFVGPVRMDKITSRNKDGTVPQPNLRPATVGDITLGNEIGEIKLGKNTHTLYDYIEVDGTNSLADKIRRETKFNLGGLVQRPNR